MLPFGRTQGQRFHDQLVRQQIDASAGGQWPPGSMLATLNRVARGTNNLDMTPDEFLTHVRTDQRQYFLERLREYEAMLHMLGLLVGAVGTEAEQKAAREALVAALEKYISTLEVRNPMSPKHPGAFVSPSAAIFAKMQECFGYEEAAEQTRRSSQIQNAMQLEMQLRVGEMIVDFLTSVWNSLVEWWNNFWRIYKTEGLLIAMNRARIDATFLAAEVAIDIAITVALGGAGAALAGALKGLRFVGMRTARGATRVLIKAIPDGVPNPRAVVLIEREIRDVDIDPNIDKIVDEDRFGGAASLDDTAKRAEAKPTTAETTKVDSDAGAPKPPKYSNRKLTERERARARAASPTDELRDMVNEGQPIASPENPVPDPWLVGMNRTARLEPDHIVPLSHIMEKPGFSDLTPANQDLVLNMPENFHGLSRSANGSRGNKTFQEWTQHVSSGTPVTPELRARMILEEARMNEVIQRRIDELLRQQQAEKTANLPFRDD